jgi:hypothetical protein
MKSDNIKAGAMLAALAIAGYLAYRTYATGASVATGVKELFALGGQKIDVMAADVKSVVANNITAPFAQGQAYAATGQAQAMTISQYNHSDIGYTGTDAAGQIVTDGQWLADEAARRYSAGQLASGATPAAQSNDGAAFGVYPSAYSGFGAGGIKTTERASWD